MISLEYSNKKQKKKQRELCLSRYNKVSTGEFGYLISYSCHKKAKFSGNAGRFQVVNALREREGGGDKTSNYREKLLPFQIQNRLINYIEKIYLFNFQSSIPF